MIVSSKPIYLNTASCGLVSPATTARAAGLYAAFEYNSSTRSEEWRINEEAPIRQSIADFIGAPVQNVAMVPNFSWAINGIVQSLTGNEKVLLYKKDYPSFLEPFCINNFDITWVDAADGFNIDMPAVRNAIVNKAVDIVALSHVQWSSGYKINLEEIGALCRQYGVLFIVDATQSMGANVINLSKLDIDVFAASNYKWMNAAFGTGVLYISDSFLAQYPPVVGGHNSYKMVDGKWGYIPSAQSYEPGHPNMFGLTVLAEAIAHKNELTISYIEQHNRSLTELFVTRLRDIPLKLLGDHTMDNRSAIVYLFDENGLGDFIKQHNIIVTQRNGMLRVSMHYYNSEDDVLALVSCLQAFLK